MKTILIIQKGVLSYIIKNTLGNESISKKLIEEDCIGNYELENMLAILSCCVDEPKTKIIIGIFYNIRKNSFLCFFINIFNY